MATAVQSSSAAAANPVQPTEDLLQLKQMVQDALIKRGVLGKLKVRADHFSAFPSWSVPGRVARQCICGAPRSATACPVRAWTESEIAALKGVT